MITLLLQQTAERISRSIGDNDESSDDDDDFDDGDDDDDDDDGDDDGIINFIIEPFITG